MLKRITPYWWCQILGWGSVMVFWWYYEMTNVGFGWGLALITVQTAIPIAATDAYRRLAHVRGWISLSPIRLVPVVLLALLVQVILYMLMSYLIYQLRYSGHFWGVVFMGALGGGIRYHAIWLLAFHLYHYARQSAESKAAAAEAHLARLSTELNPHFLFNALNGIKALTREDPTRARRAIDQLSRLLRGSLGHGRAETVTLEEELNITLAYTQLEQLRLEERLQIKWCLDSVARKAEIPPFSLHTLVENAIKHGIASLPAGGTISVAGELMDEYYRFSVTNDGGYWPQKDKGTGLTNLRERLRLLYGAAARVELSGNDHSTLAELIIPIRP